MNNVNVNFEVENSTEDFPVNKRKSIINIRSVEDSHRINFVFFRKNKINKTFDEFRYDDIDKHNKNCIHVFVIAVL